MKDTFTVQTINRKVSVFPKLSNFSSKYTAIDYFWAQNIQIDDVTSLLTKIQVMHWNEWAYPPIVEYTSQYVNVLIFLHYFAIVLVYLKSKEEIYLLEVSSDQWRSERLARLFSPNLIFPNLLNRANLGFREGRVFHRTP